MVWVVNATPQPLYPRKIPDIHNQGEGVGPTAGLDWRGTFSPPGFDPRTVQPIASSCIDYAVPTETCFCKDPIE